MIVCKECKGTGKVVFTRERGGPRCNNCGGAGAITPEFTQRAIARMLDHPSVYMGGPSHGSLRRAGRIVEWMVAEGFFATDEQLAEKT